MGHMLPQDTSLSTIFFICNWLNNINQSGDDVHPIPVLLHKILANIVDSAGQIALQQLLDLVEIQLQSIIDVFAVLM